jgi:hypothetical protein
LRKSYYQTTGPAAAKYSLRGLFGDHIRKVPPVPFPNTVVKLSEPMIVPTSAKVGIAEFLKTLVSLRADKGFFVLGAVSDIGRMGGIMVGYRDRSYRTYLTHRSYVRARKAFFVGRDFFCCPQIGKCLVNPFDDPSHRGRRHRVR